MAVKKRKGSPLTEILLALYGRLSEADFNETGATDQIDHLTVEAPVHPRLTAFGVPITVVGTYVDNDLSAADVWTIRHDFERLICDIRFGRVNAVAAREFDRLYRQPLDFHRLQNELEKAGGRFLFSLKAGEWVDLVTGEGRLMAGVMGEVNADYVRSIAEKIRNKHKYLLGKGLFAGGTRRFGYTPRMEDIDPDEYQMIRNWVDRILLHGVKTNQLATELNELEVPTASAGRWLAGPLQKRVDEDPREDDPEIFTAVRNMLSSGISMKHVVQQLNAERVPCVLITRWQATTINRILTGDYIRGFRNDDGTLIKASWPAIITEEESTALRAAIHDPDHPNNGNDTRAKYPFSSKMRCGLCDTTLYPNYYYGVRNWACLAKPGGCAKIGRRADALESWLLAELLAQYSNSAWVDGLIQAQASGDDVDVADLTSQLRKIDDALSQTETDYRAPETPEDQLAKADYRRIKSRLQAQRVDINRQIRDATARRANGFDVDLITSGEVWKRWPDLKLSEQQMLVSAAIKYVIVKPVGRGRKATPENSYEIMWAA